jgi:hypothetical protein
MKNSSKPANERQAICVFPDCGRDALGSGLCNAHLAQKKTGRPLKPVGRVKPRRSCTYKGCTREVLAKKLCKAHYYQQRAGKALSAIFTPRQGCSVEGCTRKHSARGYCNYHWNLATRKKDVFGLKCRVNGCDRPVMNKKHRLCGGHYAQYKRGSRLRPLARKLPRVDADGRPHTIAAYLEQYTRIDANGCWVWTGNISAQGYGLMSGNRLGKKGKVFAHRVAWALRNGFEVIELPAKLSIDHTCRNRACVNPVHLTLMPVAENLGNMLAWHALQAAKNLYERECERLQNEITQLEALIVGTRREPDHQNN